jgi:hypothetical protein
MQKPRKPGVFYNWDAARGRCPSPLDDGGRSVVYLEPVAGRLSRTPRTQYRRETLGTEPWITAPCSLVEEEGVIAGRGAGDAVVIEVVKRPCNCLGRRLLE